MGKCIDCKYMKPEAGYEHIDNWMYVCTNPDCASFGEYTGICCEDECEDWEAEDEFSI